MILGHIARGSGRGDREGKGASTTCIMSRFLGRQLRHNSIGIVLSWHLGTDKNIPWSSWEFPPNGKGHWEICPPFLIHPWLRAAPGSVNSLDIWSVPLNKILILEPWMLRIMGGIYHIYLAWRIVLMGGKSSGNPWKCSKWRETGD